MVPSQTVRFVFSRVLMFRRSRGKHRSGLKGKQKKPVSRGTKHEVLYHVFRLSLQQSWQKQKKIAVVFGARATTAQLYHGRDTFEFDRWHVTKNQPITALVLLSESLGI